MPSFFMNLFSLHWLQVPADGILISGQSLALDESSMTGESKIVSVSSNLLGRTSFNFLVNWYYFCCPGSQGF